MKQILEIAFSGFWQFIGIMILLYVPVQILGLILKFFAVLKCGWPPKKN